MTDRKISLLLIDSNMLFIEGLQALLATQPAYEILGLLTDPEEGLKAFKKGNPDIVILSDCIIGMNIITLVQEIFLSRRSAKIMILAGKVEKFIVMETIKLGVAGFLARSNNFATVSKAIQKVHDNQTFYCDQVSHILAQSIVGESDTSSIQTIFNGLTNREKEIMIALLDGMSINAISASLNISRKTVTTHKSKIYKKFGFSNIVEFVKAGTELGF